MYITEISKLEIPYRDFVDRDNDVYKCMRST